MADPKDKKVSELTDLSLVDKDSDHFYVVDVSAPAGSKSKRVSLDTMLQSAGVQFSTDVTSAEGSDVTLDSTQLLIDVNTSLAAVEVTLPDASLNNRKEYVVYVSSYTYSATITTTGVDVISFFGEDETSLEFVQKGDSIHLVSNGNKWIVI